ncbi:hypothetical protein PVAR5_0873 [Paecilomyces variotii No. 5]|uniref:Uncharacterized protein n=1 Tax=Byssochlamys spectabilis (strain No. 5 / NBRC 109023) TaxID=1356009 RepID=V5FKE9_BYSSN|nr:hypothetical protein PVAR5_0873 [Paecilomyces variotii No. 5]
MAASNLRVERPGKDEEIEILNSCSFKTPHHRVALTDLVSSPVIGIRRFLAFQRERADFGHFTINISNWRLEQLRRLYADLLEFVQYLRGAIDALEAKGRWR